MADRFSAFPIGNQFSDLKRQGASCHWQIAEICYPTTILFELQLETYSAINRIAASQFLLSAD
jgi:hypothetical protein